MQAVNDQVLSVSEFNREVKLVLETEISSKWVRGEVSNLRRQSSGHVYFTLKDAESQLSCVLFRGNAVRQSVQIQEGQQILVYGEISVYEPRGSYQLIVAIVLADGQGKLQVAFEQLKQKLAAEGLFDGSRKKAIPVLPRTIGIITSPTGAAIRDFISVLRRRGWRGRLVVIPSKVQGNEAAPELISQVKRAVQMGIFDLLVIARGGGSLEDLWPFNEEALVRAVADCPIPVISGVGHEIDFTLVDFVADLRAETPTGAAEFISSNFLRAKDRLDSAIKELRRSTTFIVDEHRHHLVKLEHRLKAQSPQNYIYNIALRLDDAANRMLSSVERELFAKRDELSELKARLLATSPEASIKLLGERLKQIQKRLMNNSIESGLKRGFILLKDMEGRYVTRKTTAEKEKELDIIFADGKLSVEVKLGQ